MPPTITVTDADRGEPSQVSRSPQESDGPQPPGSLPDGPAPPIPEWYKVGWRAVGGIDEPATEGEEKEKTALALFINEMYYGTWYHNAGIIFFVCLPAPLNFARNTKFT